MIDGLTEFAFAVAALATPLLLLFILMRLESILIELQHLNRIRD